MISLYKHQEEALSKMKNGCILCGGVGSGKSRTSLAYFFTMHGGGINSNTHPMTSKHIPDLYIITTAKKRDKKEWDAEMQPFNMSSNPEYNYYKNDIYVDSWNNIKKYSDVKGAFFIFDEQRLVGNGAWVKAFYKIAAHNKWILLSATPGDTWMDYIPVFVANGYFRNRTDFINRHVVYSRFSKFPKVDRYVNDRYLMKIRDSLLIPMYFERPTMSVHVDIYSDYDKLAYKALMKSRWNAEKNKPIESASELCTMLRKICNTDPSRLDKVVEIVQEHHKVIIFYNYNYELELLKNLDYGMDISIAEWNGHKHEEVPTTDNWVYLVQYTAGAEGWNCITTDTMIFFSENYSYRTMIQASGRIDRLNTPFKNLLYYHLKTHSSIDLSIARALKNKKKFNESKFAERN